MSVYVAEKNAGLVSKEVLKNAGNQNFSLPLLKYAGGGGGGPVLAQVPPMPMTWEKNSYEVVSLRNKIWELTAQNVIYNNKKFIKVMAEKHNLQSELIAGILYNEANPLNKYDDMLAEQAFENGLKLNDPTVGIAQVSAVTAMIELNMGFDPHMQDEIIKQYCEFNKFTPVPTIKDINNEKDQNKRSNMLELRQGRIKEFKENVLKNIIL